MFEKCGRGGRERVCVCVSLFSNLCGCLSASRCSVASPFVTCHSALTSLTLGMFVTGEWSKLSQATWGDGSPRARHATTAPELLVKVTTLGGGSTNTGPAGAVDVRTVAAAPVRGEECCVSFMLEWRCEQE